MPRFSLQAAIPVFLFLGIGGMCITFGVMQAMRQKEQQNWPAADALILESDVALFNEEVGPEVKLLVEYSVGGVNFEEIVYATDVRKPDFVPPRYDSGNRVTIYYDPKDPSSAIRHRPSLVPSIWVIVIGFVPVVPAMFFVVYWLAMGYAKLQLIRARRYLREAEQDLVECNNLLRQIEADGDEVPPELFAEQKQLEQATYEIRSMLDELQTEIDSMAPLEDEDVGEVTISPALNTPVRLPPSTLGQRLLQTVVMLALPTLLGLALSWWAPFYLITCERNAGGSVDCELQQVLFGFVNQDEVKTITDLREVEYEMRGERRKQRAFLLLTGAATTDICAGRAAISSKSINEFLTSPDSQRLRLSDGHTILGLYVPWVLVMFSIVSVVIINEDCLFPKRCVQFAMGSFLMGCLAGLPFVFFFDIYYINFYSWLMLALVISSGGFINVARLNKSGIAN